jgi:protein-tyrosine phosphatase
VRTILPGSLWLGNALDVDDLSGLLDAGVQAIVCLAAEELPPRITRDLIYCRYPVLDGAGNSPETLRAAIDSVASLVRSAIPVLVHCGAGMSRSPAIVAAALATLRGTSPEDELTALVRNHPHDVSPLVWQEIKQALRRANT